MATIIRFPLERRNRTASDGHRTNCNRPIDKTPKRIMERVCIQLLIQYKKGNLGLLDAMECMDALWGRYYLNVITPEEFNRYLEKVVELEQGDRQL